MTHLSESKAKLFIQPCIVVKRSCICINSVSGIRNQVLTPVLPFQKLYPVNQPIINILKHFYMNNVI